MSAHGPLNTRGRAIVALSVVLVTIAVILGTARLWGYIADRSATDRRLTAIAEQNHRNGDLLVDCVTPGADPPPVTGHACWDRLHDPRATGDAVAIIVDDLYCDQRRAQHKLPAVPDPRIPCRSQTSPDVYPGGTP